MKVYRDVDRITVKEGERFSIGLNVLAAAGYEWVVADCPAVLKPLESEFKLSSNAVGGESEQILQFEAEKSGKGVLRLICKRQWDDQASETRSVKVAVVK